MDDRKTKFWRFAAGAVLVGAPLVALAAFHLSVPPGLGFEPYRHLVPYVFAIFVAPLAGVFGLFAWGVAKLMGWRTRRLFLRSAGISAYAGWLLMVGLEVVGHLRLRGALEGLPLPLLGVDGSLVVLTIAGALAAGYLTRPGREPVRLDAL